MGFGYLNAFIFQDHAKKRFLIAARIEEKYSYLTVNRLFSQQSLIAKIKVHQHEARNNFINRA